MTAEMRDMLTFVLEFPDFTIEPRSIVSILVGEGLAGKRKSLRLRKLNGSHLQCIRRSSKLSSKRLT